MLKRLFQPIDYFRIEPVIQQNVVCHCHATIKNCLLGSIYFSICLSKTFISFSIDYALIMPCADNKLNCLSPLQAGGHVFYRQSIRPQYSFLLPRLSQCKMSSAHKCFCFLFTCSFVFSGQRSTFTCDTVFTLGGFFGSVFSHVHH